MTIPGRNPLYDVGEDRQHGQRKQCCPPENLGLQRQRKTANQPGQERLQTTMTNPVTFHITL